MRKILDGYVIDDCDVATDEIGDISIAILSWDTNSECSQFMFDFYNKLADSYGTNEIERLIQISCDTEVKSLVMSNKYMTRIDISKSNIAEFSLLVKSTHKELL